MKKLSIFIAVILTITLLVPQGCTKDKLVDDFMCEDNERITYDDVRSILTTKCSQNTACHVPGGFGVSYLSYESAFPSLNASRFENRVLVLGDMPTVGWPQLDSIEYYKIRCWIEGGYLEE